MPAEITLAPCSHSCQVLEVLGDPCTVQISWVIVDHPCHSTQYGPEVRRTLTFVGVLWQVAEARSDETFVALCLLTVTGASLLTQKLGFSDTMGAFVAGVLLAETNYSTQACSCSIFLEPTQHALYCAGAG